jgi:hypothetical protein
MKCKDGAVSASNLDVAPRAPMIYRAHVFLAFCEEMRLGPRTAGPPTGGNVFLSSASGKVLEESAQIAPENYPPFAASPRDQISGGDGLIKPCATNAGHRAGFRDRKSFAY